MINVNFCGRSNENLLPNRLHKGLSKYSNLQTLSTCKYILNLYEKSKIFRISFVMLKHTFTRQLNKLLISIIIFV